MENKTYRLPKKFAEEWLVALRSGEYEQTQEKLFDDNVKYPEGGYCCLGVAGAICGYSTEAMYAQGELSDLAKTVYEEDDEYDTYEHFIPNELINTDLATKCISMNDSLGMSFIEIADWIEENVMFYEEAA